VGSFGFTGEVQDDGGLTYLRARWYHPGQGTLLGRDPFAGFAEQPYSQQYYQYAYSNPVNWTDPSGRCVGPVAILCLIGGGLAALTAAGGVIANDPTARNAAEDLGQSATNTVEGTIDNVRTNAPRGFNYIIAGVQGQVAGTNGKGSTSDSSNIGVACAVLDQAFLNIRSQATTNIKTRKWNNRSRLTIVELGAGDYKYAITLKKAFPNAKVYATNDPNIWEEGKLFSSAGLNPSDTFQGALYAGYQAAKAAGVLVGEGKPFTNQDLVQKGVKADIVYSVSPNPTQRDQFGAAAARIAKRTPGTLVAVMSSGADEFIAGFNSVRPNSRFFSTQDLSFDSAYEETTAPFIHIVGIP
jgi:RHS repeat-associated protein